MSCILWHLAENHAIARAMEFHQASCNSVSWAENSPPAVFTMNLPRTTTSTALRHKVLPTFCRQFFFLSLPTISRQHYACVRKYFPFVCKKAGAAVTI
jgi:hypothetical protein